MKSILEILTEIRPECDFKSADEFIEGGLLDSFDVVSLVSELENTFGFSITGTDILPENFRNTAAIESLLKKYGINS
jgi:acyl carrier protein